jgi:autotransporter-associated beta strand protein
MLRAFADFTLPATRAVVLRTNGDNAAIDTNGFSVTIEGAITQSFTGSTFLKTGDGTLFLNGTNTYTGETAVIQGALGGTGSIGPVRVTNSGVLAPGQGVGTLHTGHAVFESGSGLALEFASPSAGDQLSVTGSVTLGADVLLTLDLGYTVTGSDTFIVMLNDGGDAINTSGGFFVFGEEQLTEGESFVADGATWTISYIGGTGNDVTLTVVPEPSTVMLCVLGGVAVLWRRRTKATRQE